MRTRETPWDRNLSAVDVAFHVSVHLRTFSADGDDKDMNKTCGAAILQWHPNANGSFVKLLLLDQAKKAHDQRQEGTEFSALCGSNQYVRGGSANQVLQCVVDMAKRRKRSAAKETSDA